MTMNVDASNTFDVRPFIQEVTKDFFKDFGTCLQLNQESERQTCIQAAYRLHIMKFPQIMRTRFVFGKNFALHHKHDEVVLECFKNREDMFQTVNDMKSSLKFFVDWAKTNAMMLTPYQRCFQNLNTAKNFRECVQTTFERVSKEHQKATMDEYEKSQSQEEAARYVALGKGKQKALLEIREMLHQNIFVREIPDSLIFYGFLFDEQRWLKK